MKHKISDGRETTQSLLSVCATDVNYYECRSKKSEQMTHKSDNCIQDQSFLLKKTAMITVISSCTFFNLKLLVLKKIHSFIGMILLWFFSSPHSIMGITIRVHCIVFLFPDSVQVFVMYLVFVKYSGLLKEKSESYKYPQLIFCEKQMSRKSFCSHTCGALTEHTLNQNVLHSLSPLLSQDCLYDDALILV